MFTKQIFTDQAADGDSDIFSLNGNTRVKIAGNFGGGTIQIHSSADNVAFSTTGTENDRTEAGESIIIGQQGFSYKLVLTGSTGANLNAWVSL